MIDNFLNEIFTSMQKGSVYELQTDLVKISLSIARALNHQDFEKFEMYLKMLEQRSGWLRNQLENWKIYEKEEKTKEALTKEQIAKMPRMTEEEENAVLEKLKKDLSAS